MLASMMKFDPVRYAGLSMANPDPSQTCTQGSSSNETGLAWDMISQVGALLRSGNAASPLARLHVGHEYLTGYSQSGGYMVTYINDFAPHFTQANGSPIRSPRRSCNSSIRATTPTSEQCKAMSRVFAAAAGSRTKTRRRSSAAPRARRSRSSLAPARHIPI
jgi:Alpha/beta hydrolase domain